MFMKRHLLLLRSLILAAICLAAVSCSDETDIPVPGDGQSVHIRVRTPNPIQVGTKAVSSESAVNRIALMVFKQNGGGGDFLYQYTAEGKNLDQVDDYEADFKAMVRMSDEPVKLLVIANYPDGFFNGIDLLATENDVRDALVSADLGFSQGLPMTGAKELDALTENTGIIRVPMLRSISKVTIAKSLRVGTPAFTITSVTTERANNRYQ